MKNKNFGLSLEAPWLLGIKLLGIKSSIVLLYCQYIRLLQKNVTRGEFLGFGWEEGLDGKIGYIRDRANGTEADSPSRPFPDDGNYSWNTPENDESYIRYTEGPGDKVWMEERDWNYLRRLQREGTLLKYEPNAVNEISLTHKYSREIVSLMQQARLCREPEHCSGSRLFFKSQTPQQPSTVTIDFSPQYTNSNLLISSKI